MPELPEIETLRRALEPILTGQRLDGADVRETRLRWPVDPALNTHLKGRRIIGTRRRSKYLIVQTDAGALLVHLGMSGVLTWHQHSASARTPALKAHDHVDLHLESGVLRYHDPRRFGAILWYPQNYGSIDTHPLFQKLGIEPFDSQFDGAWLFNQARRKTIPVKNWLLNGTAVVGVGNIYASEALFRAGIRPTRTTKRLTRKQCDSLASAIRATLAQAIEFGGSTLRDYRHTDGSLGGFQQRHQVYDRAGAPCVQCGTAIRLIRQQQRSTYFCPQCQP